MLKFILLTIIIFTQLQAQLLKYDIKPSWLKSNSYKNIKILDSMELDFKDFNAIEVNELSALAYKKNKLFAISNRGYLYHFNIQIQKNKVINLKLEKAVKLKKKNNKKLKKKHRDAEGMVLVDNKLYISFERKPRVDIFSLNGKRITRYKLDDKLENIFNYQSKNKALEAIAYNKKYGIIVGAEKPLKNEDSKYHVLYAKNNTWRFEADASLTAMEFIDENELLTLERSFNSFSRQRIIILKKVTLTKEKNTISKSKILARLDSYDGWHLDNFEGLTKVGKKKFLMISDDNRGFFQKTLLVLFEIK